MILGKSNHPVEIKKVKIRVWTLRSEIEFQLSEINQIENENEKNTKIEDLKNYFKLVDRTGSAEIVASTITGKMDDKDSEKKAESVEDEKTEGEESEEGKAEGEDGVVKDDDGQAKAEGEDGVAAKEEEVEEEEASNVVSLYPKDLKMIERKVPKNCGHGFIFLADLNMKNGLLFTSAPFTIGQTVVIEFLVPKRFFISCSISYCRNLSNNSNIISESRPKFRLYFNNILSYPGERTHLRDFLKSVEPEIPVETIKALTASDDDEDMGDLDELADFGF